MFKRWIAVIVPALALAITATSASASTTHCSSRVPSGKYQATINEPASLKGVWTIEFHSGTDTGLPQRYESRQRYVHHLRLYRSRSRSPPYRLARQKRCRTPGKYTFRQRGRTLTFTKISDPCNSVRSEILSHRYIHIR